MSTDLLDALDALGNYIEVQGTYGYTTDQNGLTEVNLGKAVKLTSKGLVTLNIHSTTSQYTPTSNRSGVVASNIKTVSVKPIKLFKIKQL